MSFIISKDNSKKSSACVLVVIVWKILHSPVKPTIHGHDVFSKCVAGSGALKTKIRSGKLVRALLSLIPPQGSTICDVKYLGSATIVEIIIRNLAVS